MNSNEKPVKEAKTGRRSRLARGVRVFANPQRGNWMVQVLVDGKRATTSWPTQEAAMEHARTCSAAKKEHGSVAMSAFSGEEVRAWMQVREALQGAPLKALLDCWEKHGKAFRGGMAVSEAVDAYLALTLAEQTHGEDTRRHVTKALARFTEAFGTRPLPSITTDELRAWVPAACKQYGLGADARNALVKQVRALFNRGETEGWCDVNPAKAVATTRVTRDEVSILSLADAKKLFSTLRDEPISLRLLWNHLVESDTVERLDCRVMISSGRSGDCCCLRRRRKGQLVNNAGIMLIFFRQTCGPGWIAGGMMTAHGA